MNSGTMGGLRHFAMHTTPAIWKPWGAHIINDAMVHGCLGGADSRVFDAQAEIAAKGSVDYSAAINSNQGSCIFFELDADELDQVPRLFDVVGKFDSGMTRREADDVARAAEVDLRVPVKPKANGYAWASAMQNSCVVMGSYKRRNLRGGYGALETVEADGPLSGLEHKMHI
jgi:hypothetical protein